MHIVFLGLMNTNQRYWLLQETNKRNGSAIRINIPPPALSRSDSEEVILKRFPEERIKTLVAFMWLTFNFMFATISLALTHERLPDPRVVNALPDIILDSITPQDWALTVSEILLSGSTFVAFFTMAVHKHRWDLAWLTVIYGWVWVFNPI